MNEINKDRKTIRLSSLKYNVHHSVTYIITDSTAGGLFPLPYCLPVDTSELGTGSGLISEETAGLSVGDDCWLLLDDDDDFFCWCNDDVFDRSLEEDGVSLSKEDCRDLACDVLRGQCWRHKLLAMTRFWWSSCGNRPVTWYKRTRQVTPRLRGPLRALNSSNINTHSTLPTAFSYHLLTFTFSASSNHVSLDFPILLFPPILLFLTTLPRSILSTCPIHSHHSFLTLSHRTTYI